MPHGAYSQVSTTSSHAENGQRLEVAKTGAVSAAGERESGLMMMFFLPQNLVESINKFLTAEYPGRRVGSLSGFANQNSR